MWWISFTELCKSSGELTHKAMQLRATSAPGVGDLPQQQTPQGFCGTWGLREGGGKEAAEGILIAEFNKFIPSKKNFGYCCSWQKREGRDHCC